MTKYIIIILIVLLVLVAFRLVKKMSSDYARDRESIRSRGGMRSVYAVLIDGILEYGSAKIDEEDDSEVVIKGEFKSVADGVNHGGWTVTIKHTFNVVQVTYNTKIYFNDVVQGNKHWEFPVDKNQSEILQIVRTQMESVSASHELIL